MFALANAISTEVAKLTTKVSSFCFGLRARTGARQADTTEQMPEPFYSHYDLSWWNDDDLPFAR